MAISLNEQLIPLSEAARRLPALKPSKGPGLNPATVWRWATKGSRGVVLETIFVGSVRCTSVEALERFLAARNAPTPIRLPSQQAKQAVVEAELAERGY